MEHAHIQVEHNVKEVMAATSSEEQIRIAAGQPLRRMSRGAEPRLHAIQCRINARCG
jgi:acetyl/propionyl-CoA carboxylase alpha subunit